MLYFRALEQGLAQMPEADPLVRAALDKELHEVGLMAMHQQLKGCDPVAAARIHPNDPQRILRALEVYRLSGKPISQLQQEAMTPFPYPLLRLVRAPLDRTLLRQRIADRFQLMLKQGFEEEVRALWARGNLNADLPAMRSVGYRQMLMYLCGEVDYQRMTELAITATRQLAKRQMTWLRGYGDLNWLSEETDLLPQVLKRIETAQTLG
jgi:tRNA dimethylallyltransferase